MIKCIKSHIKNNKGDLYIQTLICLMIFIVAFLFIFQVSSSMTQKMWLDDKLNDITKIIAVTGDVSCDDVSTVENMVIEKMGGTFSYESDDWVDASKPYSLDGRVQLGGPVYVVYENPNYPIITIGDDFEIKIDINIKRQGFSEKYFKPD